MEFAKFSGVNLLLKFRGISTGFRNFLGHSMVDPGLIEDLEVPNFIQEMRMFSRLEATVAGSEIPFPTTWDGV